ARPRTGPAGCAASWTSVVVLWDGGRAGRWRGLGLAGRGVPGATARPPRLAGAEAPRRPPPPPPPPPPPTGGTVATRGAVDSPACRSRARATLPCRGPSCRGGRVRRAHRRGGVRGGQRT